MDIKPEIYRVQAQNKETLPYLNKQCPVKRVVVLSDGKMELNPDSQKFIYFSKTQKHHCYYIFNKMLKMVLAELNRLKKDPYFDKAKLPEDFRVFTYTTHVNIDAIKQARNIFTNHVPPKELELITLQYMESFNKLLNLCVTENHKKTFGSDYPEFSDKSTFGGAYGINSHWLDLLKTCTISTKTTNVTLERFFDFLLDCAKDVKVSGQRLTQVLQQNEVLFVLMNMLKYSYHNNPEFKYKDNINNMMKLLSAIENDKMYSPQLQLDKKFFTTQRKIFKEEYQAIR